MLYMNQKDSAWVPNQIRISEASPTYWKVFIYVKKQNKKKCALVHAMIAKGLVTRNMGPKQSI